MVNLLKIAHRRIARFAQFAKTPRTSQGASAGRALRVVEEASQDVATVFDRLQTSPERLGAGK